MDCKLHQILGVSLRTLFPNAQFCGVPDMLVRTCHTDPEACSPGSVFVWLEDGAGDEFSAVATAVDNGASAILTERLLPAPIPMCVVPDIRRARGELVHALADYDHQAMHVVGVTGTHGKTATSELIHSVLSYNKTPSSVVNSLRDATEAVNVRPRDLCPQPEELAQWLDRAWGRSCRHAVLEVSSTMLADQRLAGMQLAAAVITNIRQDHLDLHGSVRSYRAIKQRILESVKPDGCVILNADDPFSSSLADTISNPTLTYGIHQPAQITAQLIERCKSEQTFLIQAGNATWPVRTRIIGHQHIYRCLAAAAYGLVAGYPMERIVAGLEAVEELPGELQRLECGQEFGVFIHSASTPDRLAVALKTLKTVTRGRVIVVASARHDSNPVDRAVLGRTAEKYGRTLVFTSDSHASTHTDGLTVLHDMLDGCETPARVHAIPSRLHAFQWAMSQANEDDCLLIANHGDGFLDDAFLLREWLYDRSHRRSEPVLAHLRLVSPN